MRLIPEWRHILKRAWSVRLLAVAAALSGAEIVLPLYTDQFSRGTFAALSLAVTIGAFVARFVAQAGPEAR